MPYIIRLFLLCALLSLTACTTFIAKRIHNAQNSVDRYPAAVTANKKLMKTVEVDLNQYQSAQTRVNQERNFALAVAISGGGYRSANLGLGVLLGLEKIQNKMIYENLLQEVDYFSTVSGGGLAVGFYLTQLHNFLEFHHNVSDFSLNNETKKMLAKDHNPLQVNLMQYFFSNSDTKGLKVEKILNDTLLSTPEGGLVEGDIFVPKHSQKRVQLPYWIINTTIYQNATSFPFTPDVIHAYEITGYYHNNQHYYFLSPTQNSPYTMPVSVGLMASMSPPIAVPSTTLVSRACIAGPCYLQLYDGGISDTLGIGSALHLLAHDQRKIKVLIVVDSGRDLIQPFSQIKRPPSGMPLVARLTSISTDGYRKYVMSHLQTIAQNTLCSGQTTNVITIYLDLANYPKTQRIIGELKITPHNQRLLLMLGQQLVAENKTLSVFLSQLSQGKISLGECTQVSHIPAPASVSLDEDYGKN